MRTLTFNQTSGLRRWFLASLCCLFILSNGLAQEGLVSSDFESQAEGWNINLLNDAAAQGNVVDGEYCLDVTNGGPDVWSVQLGLGGFGLESGQTYTLSFDAYASRERGLRATVGAAGSSENAYSESLALTTEKQTFTDTFTAEEGAAEADLTFFSGGKRGEENPAATVCFDNVSLSAGAVEMGENLFQNPGFDEGDAAWSLGAYAPAEASGEVRDGAYCTVVNATGENPWSIALRQGNLDVQPGKTYTLAFDAYADKAAQVGVKIGQSREPYAEYFYQAQAVGTEAKRYSLDIDMTADDPAVQLELFLGGPLNPEVPVNVCFDNLSLAEVTVTGTAREIPYIMLDQFGYRPEDAKVAVLIDPQEGFNADDEYVPGGVLEVRKVDGDETVFSGAPEAWNDGAVQENSGDRGWWFDFSDVTEPGNYYVYDVEKDARSYEFTIADDVYNEVLKAATRMFFYNRANTAKEEPFADARWTDEVSFVGPGQDTEARFVEDKENADTARDLSGGWFDAGDYNKYVTFAQAPVHVLLTAYEQNSSAFTDDFNIPESGNGLPDLLDELLWEFDWLKKMQVEDGGVIIKVGNIDYNSVSPPSQDPRPRYYAPVCSSASIAAASMFAHGALVFGGFEELSDYAADLGDRAVRAYDWYVNNPRRDDCDSQEIKAGDADRTLNEQDAIQAVAAVYLYALTGEQVYQDALEATYQSTRAFSDSDTLRWSMYDPDQGDALLYYTTLKNADPELAQTILDAKLEQATSTSLELYGFQPEQDLYRAFLPEVSYHWGSNYVRSALGNTNLDMLHYDLNAEAGESYREKALGIVHYLHGVNPLNMVYLTNMVEYGAEYSANEMWHDWFRDGSIWDDALTSERGPAPGYVPGGPNAAYSGQAAPPAGEPAQKAYRDWNTGSAAPWEITEPAIYYQAAYVKLLSNFVAK